MEEVLDEKYSERVRTFSILKRLMQGKHLKLDDVTIAMGDDMGVGFLYDGRVVSPMGLHELNSLLNKFNIGIPVK